MGGAVALPLVVEVAFGEQPLDTGALTWTDISDYVKRAPGVDFLRGWDTETGEPIAGRLSFTVNNDDGDFTPGATGAFGEVRNRLPVRVSAVIGTATGNALTYDEGAGWYDMLGATYDDSEIGTVVLWTGLVETWRQSWENGVRSQVQVTCVDRWAAIRRLKIDPDRIALAAETTGADLFYPCTDASLPLREIRERAPEMSSGWLTFPTPAPTVAAVSHPTDPSKSVPQWSGNNSGTTVYVSSNRWADTVSLDAGVSVTVVLKPSATYAAYHSVMLEYGPSIDLGVNMGAGLTYTGGALRAYAFVSDGVASANASGGAVTDFSRWYTVTATATRSGGTVSMSLYLDGDLVDTDSASVSDWGTMSTFQVRFGGAGSGTDTTYTLGFAGLVVHERELTADEVDALAAGTAAWTGDTAAERGLKLTNLALPVSLSTTGTFTSTMSAQDLAGKSLADALFECATAERGTIYMDTAGWPVLTSRSWRVGSSVAFTIPAKALAADVTFTLDDQQLTNSATVDRMVADATAASVSARNDTSVTTYGEQNRSLQIWVDTDAQLLERANAEANINAVAQPRSSDLMVDILTKSATISASTLLGADIGQRIAVSGMPATAPGQDEFYIDSISDKVTASGWERTFTVSPRADYFTIADATYGQLDNVFVLAF